MSGLKAEINTFPPKLLSAIVFYHCSNNPNENRGRELCPHACQGGCDTICPWERASLAPSHMGSLNLTFTSRTICKAYSSLYAMALCPSKVSKTTLFADAFTFLFQTQRRQLPSSATLSARLRKAQMSLFWGLAALSMILSPVQAAPTADVF